MEKHLRSFNKPSLVLLSVILVFLNFLIISRVAGLAYTPFNWIDYANAYGSQLTSFTAYQEETYVFGYVDTGDIPVVLRLKTGSTVKSEITTYASSFGYFNAYFTQTIEGGDVIEVDLPNTAIISVDVAPLSVVIDKANDTMTGTGPANRSVYAMVFSYFDWQWYYAYPVTDNNGNFTADFSSQVDILLGDDSQLQYYDSNNYRTVLRNRRAHGLQVNPIGNSVWGYAAPGVEVNLTLRDNNNNIKATTTRIANNDSYFSAQFADPAIVPINIGDSVQMQFGTFPVQTVQVAHVAITSINPNTNIVTGVAPPNSKVRVNVSDSYTAADARKIVYADANGQFTADFNNSIMQTEATPGQVDAMNSNPDMAWPLLDILSQLTPDEQENLGLFITESAPSAFNTDDLQTLVSELTRLIAEPNNLDPEMRDLLSDALSQAHVGHAGSEQAVLLPDPNEKENLPAEATILTSFDILPGSFASVTYYDNQDNAVSGNSLYAGPYVRVSLNSSSLFVIGQPNEAINATLRNALGAIKGSASGTAGSNGLVYLTLYDSANNFVSVAANDVVEVTFANGTTHTVNAVNIEYIIDREARTISGYGPANSSFRLVYDRGSSTANVTSDAAGYFSHSFGWLVGSRIMEIYYRNPQGNDFSTYSYVPMFSINPDNRYLYGYGQIGRAHV